MRIRADHPDSHVRFHQPIFIWLGRRIRHRNGRSLMNLAADHRDDRRRVIRQKHRIASRSRQVLDARIGLSLVLLEVTRHPAGHALGFLDRFSFARRNGSRRTRRREISCAWPSTLPVLQHRFAIQTSGLRKPPGRLPPSISPRSLAARAAKRRNYEQTCVSPSEIPPCRLKTLGPRYELLKAQNPKVAP